MNRSTPGLPVPHQLLQFTQTHIHRVGDAIQPTHPLSSPSSPTPNPSQHQGFFPVSQLFSWGGQSTGVSASAYSFQRNPRVDLLQNGLVGSPCSPRDYYLYFAFVFTNEILPFIILIFSCGLFFFIYRSPFNISYKADLWCWALSAFAGL